MARWLRQSTSVDVPIGPFVDDTDGKTPETALTITQPDIRIKKNGGAWAQKNAAQTLTHEENGNYEVTLDTTDTNTLGLLRVHVNESGALPVWDDFLVVPSQVWDSFFSTDLLQVDLTQWLGVAPQALLGQKVQAQLDSNGVDNAVLAADTGLKSIRSGTAQAGANNSITLDAGASATTDFYKGTRIFLTNGTGAGQSRLCIAYNGTTKVATVEPDWITNPGAAATTFAIRDDASTAAIGTGGIAAASFVADMDSYTAKMWVIRQSTTADEYGVTFYKNGTPVESGVTSPLIDYVKKLSDGSILVNDATLTDQSNGDYYYSEGTNKLVAGNAYMMRVTATVDGGSRVFKQQIGRDST